jgi:hypothetical protein
LNTLRKTRAWMMQIIERLPDDLVLTIYTKFLKRYRLFEGRLIKLIDFDKYAFLQNHIGYRTSKFIAFSTEDADHAKKKYRATYTIPNFTNLSNRSNLHIDNDMICMEVVEKEDSIHYEVLRFRLKPIEFLNKEKLPSIYYRGDLNDYDWEIVSYSYSL